MSRKGISIIFILVLCGIHRKKLSIRDVAIFPRAPSCTIDYLSLPKYWLGTSGRVVNKRSPDSEALLKPHFWEAKRKEKSSQQV